MSKAITVVLALAVGLAVGIPVGGRMLSPGAEMAPEAASSGFAAVPDAIGAEDLFGPYDVVADWPRWM